MEKHLINLTIHTRVEADVNAIVRAQVELRDGTAKYIGLGRKGHRHPIADEHTYTHEQLMAFAREGLLYRTSGAMAAFAPALDEGTGLPLLMDEYQEAFRRRQLDNTMAVPTQHKMELNTAEQATKQPK